MIRASISSTAFSTGHFSLTTRFIAFAQTFSLFRIVNFQFFVNSKVGYTVNDRFDVEGAYLPELRHTFGRSNIGLAGVPADLQFASGYTSTPLSNSGRVKEKLTRLAWDLSGTYYGSWRGQHAGLLAPGSEHRALTRIRDIEEAALLYTRIALDFCAGEAAPDEEAESA